MPSQTVVCIHITTCSLISIFIFYHIFKTFKEDIGDNLSWEFKSWITFRTLMWITEYIVYIYFIPPKSSRKITRLYMFTSSLVLLIRLINICKGSYLLILADRPSVLSQNFQISDILWIISWIFILLDTSILSFFFFGAVLAGCFYKIGILKTE